jgi:hypothetical protein
MVEADRFPRWRIFWRVWYAVEAALGSLPMVLVVPSLTAIGAASWAAAHPALTVERQLVVGQRSLGYAVLNAVIGGIVVLLALIGLIWVTVWVWYHWLGGDKVWQAVYLGRGGQVRVFDLCCKEGVAPIDAIHLGAVECWLKIPSGRVLKFLPDRAFARDSTSLRVLVGTEHGPGPYDARWYRAQEGERFSEVARMRRTMNDDEPDDASILVAPVLLG